MSCVSRKCSLEVMLCLSARCRQAMEKCCNSHLPGEPAALALKAFAYGNGRGGEVCAAAVNGLKDSAPTNHRGAPCVQAAAGGAEREGRGAARSTATEALSNEPAVAAYPSLM